MLSDLLVGGLFTNPMPKIENIKLMQMVSRSLVLISLCYKNNLHVQSSWAPASQIHPISKIEDKEYE